MAPARFYIQLTEYSGSVATPVPGAWPVERGPVVQTSVSASRGAELPVHER